MEYLAIFDVTYFTPDNFISYILNALMVANCVGVQLFSFNVAALSSVVAREVVLIQFSSSCICIAFVFVFVDLIWVSFCRTGKMSV